MCYNVVFVLLFVLHFICVISYPEHPKKEPKEKIKLRKNLQVPQRFQRQVVDFNTNRAFAWNLTGQLVRFETYKEYLDNVTRWHGDVEVITNTTQEFTKLLNINVVGMSISVIFVGINARRLKHFNMLEADFYTNAYRWSLSFLRSMQKSLLDGTPYSVHRRFLRENRMASTVLIPKLLRWLVPWVPNKSWKEEEDFLKKYKEQLKHMPPTSM